MFLQTKARWFYLLIIKLDFDVIYNYKNTNKKQKNKIVMITAVEPKPLYQWSKGAFFDDNEANLFLRYCERYQNCDSDEMVSCEKYKCLKKKFESYCLETGNYWIASFYCLNTFTKINLDFYITYDYILGRR